MFPSRDTSLPQAPLSHDFFDARMFGVGQEAEPFRILNPQSVALPSWLSLSRLDYGRLRQEPAIAGLDWHFTPSHRSGERLSTAPLQASTRFYPRFTLPKARSPGFRSYPCDSRRFHTAPLASCGSVAFAADAPLQDYPCHTGTLPGTLFKTDGTTPKGRAKL